MRKLPLAAAIAALCTTSAARAQITQTTTPDVTKINFDAIAAFTTLANQFAGLGVTFSGPCIMANNLFTTNFSGNPMQAANFDALAQDCAGGIASYPAVTLTFTSPIHYFGLFGIANHLITLTDATGAISVSAPAAGSAQFVGFTDAAGTSFVTITGDLNGAVTFDDVSFSDVIVSTTPEPSSLALLLTGVAGIGTIARRRRAKA